MSKINFYSLESTKWIQNNTHAFLFRIFSLVLIFHRFIFYQYLKIFIFFILMSYKPFNWNIKKINLCKNTLFMVQLKRSLKVIKQYFGFPWNHTTHLGILSLKTLELSKTKQKIEVHCIHAHTDGWKKIFWVLCKIFIPKRKLTFEDLIKSLLFRILAKNGSVRKFYMGL